MIFVANLYPWVHTRESINSLLHRQDLRCRIKHFSIALLLCYVRGSQTEFTIHLMCFNCAIILNHLLLWADNEIRSGNGKHHVDHQPCWCVRHIDRNPKIHQHHSLSTFLHQHYNCKKTNMK